MGQLTWTLLLPRCVNIYRLMEVSNLLCVNIILVYLFVVISLLYLIIHIWIKNEFDRCPLSISFEGRKIRKIKGFNHSYGSFCVGVAFDRSVGVYVVKRCRSSHMSYVVNLSFIVGHVRFEADLSVDDRNQLANFGKIGLSFVLQSDIRSKHDVSCFCFMVMPLTAC